MPFPGINKTFVLNEKNKYGDTYNVGKDFRFMSACSFKKIHT